MRQQLSSLPIRILALLFMLLSVNTHAEINFLTSTTTSGRDSDATLTMPEFIRAGDMLITQVVIRDVLFNNDEISAPSGWTRIGFQRRSGDVLQSLYYKVAVNADAARNYNWNFSGNSDRRYILGVSVFRGVDTSNPIASQASSSTQVSSSDVISAPSVNVANANSYLYSAYAIDAGNQSFTTRAGVEEIYDIDTSPFFISGNLGLTAMAASEPYSGTGETGSKSAFVSRDDDFGSTHLVALNPAIISPIATPLLQYRMDEDSWNGSSGVVVDSGPNVLNGRAVPGANTSESNPALSGNDGTCGYGVFNGNSSNGSYVEIPDNSLLDFTDNFSVGVWIKINSIPSSGLRTIASKDNNYEFHVNSSGRINWWWQINGRSTSNEINSTVSVSAGTWAHVVISFSRGLQRIFINGVEAGRSRFTGAPTPNGVPLQIGSDQGFSGRYFNGSIDELNVFDQALTEQQAKSLMDTTRPCVDSCTLGGFDIEQPRYALACPGSRSLITIRPMCDDGVTVKQDYIGTVNLSTNENALSEFYPTPSSSTQVSSIAFDGSELGIQDVYLFHQNENPALRVIANDAASSISTTSTAFTDFRTDGFAISSPSSFTCGGSSSLTLTAIGQNSAGVECQVLEGFNGNKNLKAWYEVNVDSDSTAETVTTPMLLAGQSINAQTEPASSNITNLNFVNGVASVGVAYANAGQIKAINFQHDDAPYDGSNAQYSALFAASNAFVVKPNTVTLSTPEAGSDCASADSSCSTFVAAGSAFRLKAEAQCLGGGIADDYQGSVSLNHSLVAPAAANLGSLSVTAITINSANNGEREISNQAISEVGVFNLTATPNSYYGETIAASTLSNVGRFYPASFSLTSSSLANSCAPANGDFSYMNQLGIGVSYDLEARNAAGVKTLNYRGGFAKATMSIVAENNNEGTDFSARLSGFGSTNWGNGDYIYSDTGSFNRLASGTPNVLDGPYQDLKIGIQLADNDGNVSALNGLNMRADTSTDCTTDGNCNALALAGNLDVRFGQLKLNNVFGPETADLDMTVQTEYFDGTNFVLNIHDSCTVLTLSNVGSDNEILPASSVPSSSISSGVGTIRFDAAGIGNEGSSKYEQDTNSYLPWLNTENNNDGDYADNPFGTVTFGQFRGNDRRLYWREIVR